MTETEFQEKLTAICHEYGLEEFAIYGRRSSGNPYGWNQGEKSMVTEAGRNLSRYANQLREASNNQQSQT